MQVQSAAETCGAVRNNLHIQLTSQSTPGSPYPVAYHLHGSLLHAIDQLPTNMPVCKSAFCLEWACADCNLLLSGDIMHMNINTGTLKILFRCIHVP